MNAARMKCCAVLACLLLAACGARERTLPKEVSYALTAAYNKDDAAACTDLYSNDGAILPQSAPTVIGRAAILALFQSRIRSSLQYATDSTVSGVGGDFAFDQGTYVIRNVQLGKDIEFGKYINIFKKVDGAWKIYRTMWNTDKPAVGAAPMQSAPVESRPVQPAQPSTQQPPAQ